jgi:acyl-CoA reductase-like NAD-dependent aldehyde dehydrogenase
MSKQAGVRTAAPDAVVPAEVVARFWPDGRPRMFVGGGWVEPDGPDAGRAESSFDPSTGLVLAEVPTASADQVATAVAAARAANPGWAALTLEERAGLLSEVAGALEAMGEDLVLLESIDSGNPLSSTRRDLGLMIRYLRAWPALAAGEVGRASRPGADMLSIVTHEPYGVVGRIIAFNHPSLFALGGSIFALMAGNCVVVKAAPQTPLATLALGRAVQDVLPPGVLNLISGGAATGDALVVHPDVPRLAFTGSLPSALAIQSRLSASGVVKHLSTELGGKNAMVVFGDADLDLAVDAAVSGMSLTVSAGQSCQSTSRLLLHDSCHDEFVERLAARLDGLRVGCAYAPDAQMGPLVSAAQLERVQSYVSAGQQAGARMVCGATPSAYDAGGYFMRPVLFDGVTPDLSIAREEIFGPVLSVLSWSTYEEMIALANSTDLGLSAAVWTRDIDAALRTAADIEAGYVWVNDANRHYLGAPFGGLKNSGTGSEESVEELASYRRHKSINIRISPPTRPPTSSDDRT